MIEMNIIMIDTNLKKTTQIIKNKGKQTPQYKNPKHTNSSFIIYHSSLK
jgi:hypothetical protein